jgi:hypothetical protein
MGIRMRRALVAVPVCAAAWAGAASAGQAEERGIDPNQGDSLVEVVLPSKAAAMRLQLEADTYGVEFNEHYGRHNRNGSFTVTVFADEGELDRLAAAGYELGRTIEGPATWEARLDAKQAEVRREERAEDAATDVGTTSHEDELVILRADYFENRDGRFLSVEAKARGATAANVPVLSLTWNEGAGTAWRVPARIMNVNIDPDTTPDTYIEHRELVRIGDAGVSTPPAPTRIRIGSSTNASIEGAVNVWLGGGLPPMSQKYRKDFTTRYMDPTEVYASFNQLAQEYSNIAEMIPLPYATNGYQRRAQATMAGTTAPGNSPPGSQQGGAVVLTSTAWGHLGGNSVSAEFRNPNAPDQPLQVVVDGTFIAVNLATNASSQLTSTAAQVVAAINANADARALVVARTFRNNAGAGIVQPTPRNDLSDFLTRADGANNHVQRGPFNYSVMRIGKKRDGSKVGVFLYCQQHAREWATPLTCLETAQQLLTNYTLDGHIREMVNNLDIFILPVSNPDGAHYSMYNFSQQRRNLTNHCVVGGKVADDTSAANYWTTRPFPGQPPGTLYTQMDPANRNGWGVDLNRNNTFGTLFDTFGGQGYIGASHSCTNDTYAGPSEASEPEIRNELWVADTYKNIKFSNNIHSFGGYFMWAPGTYLTNRDEGDAVHANIGVEKYFFAAGDRILNRIKESRNTVILPERTGPIADVLYSAAGNSADEHWYNRDVIAYSFETGADLFRDTSLTQPAAAGATAVRVNPNDRTGFGEGDKIVFAPGTADEEVAFVDHSTVANVPSPQPNVFLTAALSKAHATGTVIKGGTVQQGVGFQPLYDPEGKAEALEFAAGNIGLLESAFDYALDTTPPEVRMTGATSARTPVETTFEYVNEPSVIHYTMDGSAPTESSPLWDATGPREPGKVFHVTQTTTFRWIAEDIKGNVSTGRQRFVING